MSDPDDHSLKWDFQLDFNLHQVKKEETPEAEIIHSREVLREKFPHILERIELMWGSIELNNYLERTLTTDRSDRQGFPKDVIKALGQIHHEHIAFLKAEGIIKNDPWDLLHKK